MNHCKGSRVEGVEGLKTVLTGDQASLKVADETLVLGCLEGFLPNAA